MNQKEIYRTKFPVSQILVSFILILLIFTYIFWGLLPYVLIVFFSTLGIYVVSSLWIPIFILTENGLMRYYVLRFVNQKRVYPIADITSIEIRQNRKGYQAFPTMKINFSNKKKTNQHLFYFIKKNQEDFDLLIAKMKAQKITVEILDGN